MPKKSSKKQTIKFLQFLAKKNLTERVVPALFTDGELDDIAKRIAVVGYFEAGYSQRAIADTVGVSLSFVTRTLGRMRFIHDDVLTYAKAMTK